MKKKDEVIHFLYRVRDDLPAELSELYEKFCSETGYEGTKGAFSQHLASLEESNLLKKPSHGKWNITDFGKNYCSPKDEQVSEKDDIVRCLTDYFSEEVYEDVARSIQEFEHFELSLSDLDLYQNEAVDFFESHPWKFQEAVEEGLRDVFIEKEIEYKLTDYEDIVRSCSLSSLRKSSTLGEPVSAEVMVKQSAAVEAEVDSAIFECSQCGQRYEVEQQEDRIKSPYKCDCGCRKFKEIEAKQRNYMKMKLSSLRGGSDPITAVYRDKDIGEVEQKQLRPGERIQVLGIPEPKSSGKKRKTQKKIQLEILSFKSIDHKFVQEEVTEKEKQEIRTQIENLESHPFWSFAHSLAPGIYGEEELKEVVAPSLIESPPPPNVDSSEGKIHILEVSNPGKGKSDILEFAAETFGNAHYGNGRNASGVGLTASVITSENDEFDYSSGLLAKAHGGWAGIDELDNLDRKGELPDIRQAMERQKIKLDKADLSPDIPASVSVAAAANYETAISDAENREEAFPIQEFDVLDSFDLIYLKPPEVNEDADDALIDQYKGEYENTEARFEPRELKVWRRLARDLEPQLTDESAERIREYKQIQKTIASQKSNGFDYEKFSTRSTMSLIKLTLMAARARLSDEANRSDADVAIKLHRRCRRSRGLKDGESPSSKQEDKIKEALVDKVEQESVGESPPEYWRSNLVDDLSEKSGVPEGVVEICLSEMQDVILQEKSSDKVVPVIDSKRSQL